MCLQPYVLTRMDRIMLTIEFFMFEYWTLSLSRPMTGCLFQALSMTAMGKLSKDAIKRSQSIDNQLQREQAQKKNELTLLLLGMHWVWSTRPFCLHECCIYYFKHMIYDFSLKYLPCKIIITTVLMFYAVITILASHTCINTLMCYHVPFSHLYLIKQ